MTETTERALTREEWAASTERARRLARFKYAMDRVVKIADGEPRLTDEELAELADVLLSRTTERAA
jgi:uncharacterized Fe-S cluster-containing radical SAM superfamily protein